MLMMPSLVVDSMSGVNSPSKVKVVQQFLSIWSHSLVGMKGSLMTHPLAESLVCFVVDGHVTMAMFSFEIEQLGALHVPLLLTTLSGDIGFLQFPNEPSVVQKFPSTGSHFVPGMKPPLLPNPRPQRLEILGPPSWHDAMATLFFEIDQTGTLQIPHLIQCRHGSHRHGSRSSLCCCLFSFRFG